MVSPQTEDGYTRLANDIVDAMAQLILNSGESRCLWFIWRKTYGWHKKMDELALSKFTEATGMGVAHVCRSLASLKERNIIVAQQAGHSKSYGFQKDYTLWDAKGKQGRRGDTNAPFLNQNEDCLNSEDCVNSESCSQQDCVNSEANLSLNRKTQKKEKKLEKREKKPGRDAPPVKNQKPKKEKSPPDPRTNVVMKRIQEECDFPLAHWSTHAAEVKKMLALGYTEDQIFNCWKAMRDEKQQWVRLSLVAEDIGDFVANGERRRQKGSNYGRNDAVAGTTGAVQQKVRDYAFERSLEGRE